MDIRTETEEGVTETEQKKPFHIPDRRHNPDFFQSSVLFVM